MLFTRQLLLVAVGASLALPLQAQESRGTGNTRITLENEDGEPVVITVEDGSISINGNPVFRFDTESDLGGVITSLFGADLAGASEGGFSLSAFINEALANQGLADLESVIAESVNQELTLERIRAQAGSRMKSVEATGVSLEKAMVHSGDLTVRAGDRIEGDVVVLDGDANIHGIINGNLVVLDGDVRVFETGRIDGDAVTIGGSVPIADGLIRGETTRMADAAPKSEAAATVIMEPSGLSVANVFAAFIALLGIGFGVAHFFPEPFDILSLTISDASGKSFLAGAFSLPLVPVVFALGMLGLALTVVGILIIPFAAIGALGVLGLVACAGYLACARAIGDAYTRRQIRRGAHVYSGPFRSTLYGLTGLVAVWAPAAALDWVPLLGNLALLLAWTVTLVAITTGFGATVLARRDLREALLRSRRRSLTDEFRIISSGR